GQHIQARAISHASVRDTCLRLSKPRFRDWANNNLGALRLKSISGLNENGLNAKDADPETRRQRRISNTVTNAYKARQNADYNRLYEPDFSITQNLVSDCLLSVDLLRQTEADEWAEHLFAAFYLTILFPKGHEL